METFLALGGLRRGGARRKCALVLMSKILTGETFVRSIFQ